MTASAAASGPARPATMRRPGRARWSPTASIRRRIVAINAFGLLLLLGGVLYLNQFREGLIDLRARALLTEGEIIAIAIAEWAGQRDEIGLNPVRANIVLRRLAQPAGVRARIFDPGGRMTGDTRSFGAHVAKVESRPLPPPGAHPERSLLETLEHWYGRALDRIQPMPELYLETPDAGVAEEREVYAALRGDTAVATRVNSQGELIISVAVPIQRFKAVMGALVISTEGGDIDAIVKAERIAILRVAGFALLVSAVLSILLARAIARPLRRLADAAEASGALSRGPIDPRRVRLPDFSRRADEIGRLSGALSAMTDALYDRIDAIERFAADVAHEIKNPLTSLRSAVEMLKRTETPEARARLLGVIAHDVRRLDRLVTDISNASRLDAELSREETEPVDLELLLAAVADVLESQAEARGVKVVAEPPPEPLTVRGLESRLGQVFRNLADNAVSFSPRGGVVTMRAMRVAPGRVRVTVDDQGPGVPPEKRDAIFERFWSERPEGEAFGDHSGLGLSIVRQIVEAHGGRVAVEDAPGGGARFVVELPG